MAATGEKRWYIVTTIPGHENKVKDSIERRIESLNTQEYIFQVIVVEKDEPCVNKDGIPNGKTKKVNLYPGYIFVEMIMDDYAWYIVRNTQGVTGLCGSSGKGTKPTPVPKSQMDAILKQAGIVNKDMYESYLEGTQVKVLRGPMAGSLGQITSVDMDKGTVKVLTVIFGRSQELEIDFQDIEKI
ncbi:MAG: transcription termination/antitermination protein NusG [Bacilli bacterium]|nr:transcription termination/antitermination protein NusG [Bacilli bacterium]